MLKNIITKTSNLVGRRDIVSAVENISAIESLTNSDIKNDVSKMLCYYNFAIATTFGNYLELVYEENLTSNSDKKILYSSFSKKVIGIKKVEDANGNAILFKEKTDCIEVLSSNMVCKITYKYLPEDASDLSSATTYLDGLTENIICYAVASKFLASVGRFDEADEFKNEFLDEIFKIRTKKERRLKSTFCL